MMLPKNVTGGTKKTQAGRVRSPAFDELSAFSTHKADKDGLSKRHAYTDFRDSNRTSGSVSSWHHSSKD